MRLEAALLALLMVTAGTAGCIGTEAGGQAAQPAGDGTDDDEEGQAAGDPPTSPDTRTLSYEVEVGSTVSDGEPLATFAEERLGRGPATLDVEVSWTQPSNRFGVETVRPDGSEERVGPPQTPGTTSVAGKVSVGSLEAGTYGFHAVAPEGPVVEDEVTLEVEVPAGMLTPQPAPSGGPPEGEVRTQQTADGWRAEITYRANGTVSDAVDLTADTVNGAVGLSGTTDGTARAVVQAFARADTEDEAVERVREIQVTTIVEEGRVEAVAELPDDEQWEERGAHANVAVPEQTRVSGLADTTNGPLEVDGPQADGLTLDTTNGPIRGSMTLAGDLAADTTNGPIQLDLTPTSSAEISMDTTNGGIELGLLENQDVAYEVDAETTNGRISESMDEARLDRQDDGEATLVTEDGDGRPIQVTGTTDTTNGNAHFAGR